MSKTNRWFLLVVLSLCPLDYVQSQLSLGIESGALFTGYNDVRIPGSSGTLVSLNTDFDEKQSTFIRITALYRLKERHTFHVLLAPLSKRYEGTANKDIIFQGVVLPLNKEIKIRYKFNSYRIGYRYAVMVNEKTNLGLGITAKIRDADIRFESGGTKVNKANIGFVPLVNFHFSQMITPKIVFLIEGDALAAKQGRAEDVIIAGIYRLSTKTAMTAGYRFLEGGADNDEVYTFSMFHYAVFGIIFRL